MGTFLVTGGCGFIGSHLVEALQRHCHHVRVLDDLSTGKLGNVSAAAEVIVGSIVDERLVKAAMAGVDGCFHLAAIASVDRSNHDWLGTHRVNMTGTINVLCAARAAAGRQPAPVVYASSAAVYGDSANLPLCETAESLPTSAYGVDKRACELHARIATHIHRVPTVGLRFFNVYGPRQDPTSQYCGVISKFADALYQGSPVEIHGNGEQTRDFIYVEDVANILISAMERAHGIAPNVFNACSGRAASIRQLAKTIAFMLTTSLKVRHRPARPGDILASGGSPVKALRLLEWRAEIDLEQGLRRTIAWLKAERRVDRVSAGPLRSALTEVHS
jgi:UDP-glucose 4-epimerase